MMPVELEMVLRLLLAAVLGAAIGFQREKVGKQAGLRTHMLICIGSALFTIISLHGFGLGADITRVAASVVIGIGFLGGGVILHRSGGMVVGLTTAATIWLVAGLGLASGAGMYIIAAVAAAIALLILLLPHKE
jgi:putative Mg2+ transporter-C (MgtC) family protein